MNITEFKSALKAGEVTFSYKKKDGTIREARGTLCKKLLPPEKAPVVKFKCSNINWDTEGRGPCGLPDEITLELDEAWFNEEVKTLSSDNYDCIITEALVEKTGFSVLDYEYLMVEKRAPKKLAEGIVFYYDLDKASFRSFNESQLIDWKN